MVGYFGGGGGGGDGVVLEYRVTGTLIPLLLPPVSSVAGLPGVSAAVVVLGVLAAGMLSLFELSPTLPEPVVGASAAIAPAAKLRVITAAPSNHLVSFKTPPRRSQRLKHANSAHSMQGDNARD
jgi:hypothetical protein